MKTWGWIALAVVALLLVIYFYNYKLLVFSLPRSKDKDTFGPAYWRSFEKIAHSIPCPPCRFHGEKLISFMHDIVNKRLEKPRFNEENYKAWAKFVCEGEQLG